jgi:predicted RNA binding protein YcfA (HicA-like mRNA interferase family)
MGRLAGFSYQDVTSRLKTLGFEFYRSAKGDHEIWWNPQTAARIVIIRHHQISRIL